jgi:ABC-2 type transport system permease protein
MRVRQVFGLSLALAKAEFKLRNEGSYLGILWYLLNPLFTFIILLLVFSKRLGSNVPSYPAYLLVGIVLFNYFQQATNNSSRILYEHDSIIKSVRFPYVSIVISIIFRTIFSHLFELVMLIGLLFFLKISLIGMIFYPLILLFLSIFTVGVSLIISSLVIYFRDLENIWGFVSRLLWLATPIFYAVEGQIKLFIFNLFNPLFYFITASRDIIIYFRMPELWVIAGVVGYSVFTLALGLFVFWSLQKKFAEMV